MNKRCIILFEDSSPARARINQVEDVLQAAGYGVAWEKFGDNTPELKHDNTPGDYFSEKMILISGPGSLKESEGPAYRIITIENEEPRLVAIFSSRLPSDIFSDKFEKDQDLRISAEFQWQSEMVSSFLQKALPRRKTPYSFEPVSEIVPFDHRLRLLEEGAIEIGVFSLRDLDLAGVKSSEFNRFMLLPLFECPPGIYQGTTSLAVPRDNQQLVDSIQELTDPVVINRSQRIQKLFENHPLEDAAGFAIDLPETQFAFALNGRSPKASPRWEHPALKSFPEDALLVSSTDHMRSFFKHEFFEEIEVPSSKIFFVASHKSIETSNALNRLTRNSDDSNQSHSAIGNVKPAVWVAGNKTWLAVAARGIWVSGSSDGLGMETLHKSWTSGFLDVNKDEITIITNEDSAENWREEGWNAVGTYRLVAAIPEALIHELSKAEIIFWTSFQQYQACKESLSPGVKHASPAGKTATMLRAAGIQDLTVFPTIKAFIDFHAKHSHHITSVN